MGGNNTEGNPGFDQEPDKNTHSGNKIKFSSSQRTVSLLLLTSRPKSAMNEVIDCLVDATIGREPKVRYIPESRQSRQIVGWLDEEDKQEIIQGESEDEDDHISESEHNTDTEQEQEAESSDDDCDDNAPLSQFTTYKGKDGTSWGKNVPPRNVKTRACNIVTHLPDCKGQARQAKLPLETWSCLIDDNIIDDIVKYTNIYIRSIQNNFVRERHALITDQTEIKALFGLLYFAGALRSAKVNAKDLWTTDGTGLPLFRATKGINRFFFLLRTNHPPIISEGTGSWIGEKSFGSSVDIEELPLEIRSTIRRMNGV
ncbi:hypothetical protein ANN_17377 [Periplaneta americana]|uniref:PiggyBac transposable element-derived protein domain-containing protein n=1 Tax=Periplaneta americana TaxID=6978 RepID=A0ABQ8SU70_PERAM|nr:hypothetical protein ANN_17377 [Periplaneta americana]